MKLSYMFFAFVAILMKYGRNLSSGYFVIRGKGSYNNNNNNVQFLYSAYYKIVSMRLDTTEREREREKREKT